MTTTKPEPTTLYRLRDRDVKAALRALNTQGGFAHEEQEVTR